jgi:hypothetical protein
MAIILSSCHLVEGNLARETSHFCETVYPLSQKDKLIPTSITIQISDLDQTYCEKLYSNDSLPAHKQLYRAYCLQGIEYPYQTMSYIQVRMTYGDEFYTILLDEKSPSERIDFDNDRSVQEKIFRKEFLNDSMNDAFKKGQKFSRARPMVLYRMQEACIQGATFYTSFKESSEFCKDRFENSFEAIACQTGIIMEDSKNIYRKSNKDVNKTKDALQDHFIDLYREFPEEIARLKHEKNLISDYVLAR